MFDGPGSPPWMQVPVVPFGSGAAGEKAAKQGRDAYHLISHRAAASCHMPSAAISFLEADENAGYERMQDMKAQLEKLQLQMAECEMIAKLATDRAKRQLFGRLAEHYRTLAGEVERAIAAKPAC